MVVMTSSSRASKNVNWTRRGMLVVSACLGGIGLCGTLLGAAPADAAAGRDGQREPARDPVRDRLGLGGELQSMHGLRAWSRPSAEHAVSFASPGVITQILVKDGDEVKKDQILAIQNEAEEKAKLEIAKYEAGEAADQYIKAAGASLEQAKVKLKRLEQLYAAAIAAGRIDNEVLEAQVEVKVADATLVLRQHEKTVKQKQADLQETKLAEKRLKSPVDGFVLRIEVREGEGADLSKPAVRVVRNDPLWVEVDVPTARARALKIGQPLEAKYTDADEQWRQGKIIYMAPFADPRSNTRRVRLEMPNPDMREAGVQMLVRLPDDRAADKGKVQADVRPVAAEAVR
jgi:RND family efflux transporter MFP subunit